MTLEVLSSPAPADRSQKSAGRSAGEQEGRADGFSSALSRAGKGSSSSEKDSAGSSTSHEAKDDSADTPVAVGERRSARSAMREAGEHSAADDAGAKRTSVISAFSNAKGQVQGAHKDDESAVDTGEKATEDGDAATEVVGEGSGQTAGASDLLSILAGLNSAAASTATGGGARSVAGGEGRKANAATVEGAHKSDIDADGKTTRGGDVTAPLVDMPTADEAEVGPDQNFKFINAKNGTLNAELTQASKAMENTGSEAKTAAASTETVMVLDSRRIVGLPSGSNSASIMAAMVGDQSWSSAMQPDATLSNIAAQSSSGSVVHMLKLQMNPHDLGAVTATLKMSGEQLHVHLTVETRAALQQLSDDSSGMLDALRAQGFSVEQVTISISPTADTDSQKGQQGAQTGQQMAGNGERQGGANREQSGERFGQMGDSRNFDNDSSVDTSTALAPGASGSARSGQLYL